MSKIQIIKCGLCGKDIKVGFILGQGGTIIENYPFYEMYLVQNDLAKQYFEEYQRNNSEKLMCNYPICEECFEKLLNKDIIKENEELRNQNVELVKENYDLIREINELNGDMDQLM